MTWRAGILQVATLFAPRVELFLPPEHRVRATREDTGKDVVEMVIVGPMMPLLGDGELPGPVQMVMEMCTPREEPYCARASGEDKWALNGRFEIGSFRCGKILGEWNIAQFADYESFQRFMQVPG